MNELYWRKKQTTEACTSCVWKVCVRLTLVCLLSELVTLTRIRWESFSNVTDLFFFILQNVVFVTDELRSGILYRTPANEGSDRTSASCKLHLTPIQLRYFTLWTEKTNSEEILLLKDKNVYLSYRVLRCRSICPPNISNLEVIWIYIQMYTIMK